MPSRSAGRFEFSIWNPHYSATMVTGQGQSRVNIANVVRKFEPFTPFLPMSLDVSSSPHLRPARVP